MISGILTLVSTLVFALVLLKSAEREAKDD